MAEELKLADVGEGMHEAEILRWLVKPGDPVKVDQTVLEIQTDKAVVEIPAPITGTVSSLNVKEGQIAHVGDVLAVFETANVKADTNKIKAESKAETPQPAISLPSTLNSQPSIFNPQSSLSRVRAAPAVRKRAVELDVDLNQVPPSSPDGRVLIKDVEAFAVARVATPPSATKTAEQNGHAGNGRTEPRPTEQATTLANGHSQSTEVSATPVRETPKPGPAGSEERRPLVGLRRRIAERMEQSWRTIPHVTAFDEVDGTELVALRQRLKAGAEKRGTKLTYLPLIVKAVVRTLKQFPIFNASLDEQTREVIYKYSYHIGLATATPDGLLVPVVRDADKLDLITLASEINRLGEGGRNRSLKAQELSGSTFTISNVGSYGGLTGTAIINPPEAAILAVGKLQERPVVYDGQIVIRHIMPLSLSFDHRLIDGSEAGAFTTALKEILENPSLLLLDAN